MAAFWLQQGAAEETLVLVVRAQQRVSQRCGATHPCATPPVRSNSNLTATHVGVPAQRAVRSSAQAVRAQAFQRPEPRRCRYFSSERRLRARANAAAITASLLGAAVVRELLATGLGASLIACCGCVFARWARRAVRWP